MQLNGNGIRSIRNARSFWFSFLAIVFGVAFIGLGIYIFVSEQNKTYEITTAVIEKIETETIGDDSTTYVLVTYTDKDGAEHKNIRLNSYRSFWKVGDKIEIKYNVADPEDIKTPSSSFMLLVIFVALGAISTIVGIFTCIRTVKGVKRKANITKSNIVFNEFEEKNLTDTNLYFHFAGRLNQIYIVEDEQGNIVYKCILKRFNPIGASLFEFVDSITGQSNLFKIGKTVSSYSDGGAILVGDMLSSRFKINGTICWDYIADRGYEIRHLLEGKTIVRYQILKNKNVVANILPTNIKDPFNEDSKNFLHMGKGVYRLEIIDANLADITMIAFIIARTYMVE